MAQLPPLDRCRLARRRPRATAIWRAIAPVSPLTLQNYRVCCSSWARPRVADERETTLPAVLRRPIARLLDESRLDCSKLDGFARRAPIGRVRAPEAARRPPKRPPARPRRTCRKPRKRGRNSPKYSVMRTFDWRSRLCARSAAARATRSPLAIRRADQTAKAAVHPVFSISSPNKVSG